MNLKQYFVPQLIKRFGSKFNTEIELVTFSGALRLDMGNLTQSGEIIESIWSRAFKGLLPRGFSPKTVLILGFGGGSAAKLIHRKWSKAQITGVEIDPVVIKIAKEHFKVNQIEDLKVINVDAYGFVLSKDNQNHYDLIIVDCYLGDQFPRKLENKTFLKKLTKIGDHVIINRLFWGDYQPLTLDFHQKLNEIFETKTTRTASNYLIHLSAR